MTLRCFKNSKEFCNGDVIEVSIVYNYQPASRAYPEDWEIVHEYVRINGKPSSREAILRTLSTEEFEELIDLATEDKNYNHPQPNVSDFL